MKYGRNSDEVSIGTIFVSVACKTSGELETDHVARGRPNFHACFHCACWWQSVETVCCYCNHPILRVDNND